MKNLKKTILILILGLGGLGAFGQQNPMQVCNGLNGSQGVKFTIDVIQFCGAAPVTIGPYALFSSSSCTTISPPFANPSAMWIGIHGWYTNNGGSTYFGNQYSPNAFIPSMCWVSAPSNTTTNNVGWHGSWNAPVVEFH